MKLKSLITIVLIILALFGGFIFAKAKFEPQIQPATTSVSVTPVPSEAILGQQEAPIAVPKQLIIPKLQVDADIEHVGLDNKNRMDVPKGVMNVAWYQLGAKVGEVGNAVLAGHLDDPNGDPAVFFNLNKLQVGDEIRVIDENNNLYTYKVTDKGSYQTESFPLQEVFGATSKSRLNLITCEGVFNTGVSSYSHRLVVYSELVE